MTRVGGPGSGYDAFVPNSLAPETEWTHESVRALSAAERALGKLGGVGQTLPKPIRFREVAPSIPHC